MKRKVLFLGLALAATAALGAGAWALQRAQEAQESALAQVETVQAASLSGEVTRIAYGTSDGGEVCLTLSDGVWQSADNDAFPLTQSYAQTMASLASNVGATKLVLEDCTDLAEYGLDEPQKHIEAETDAGEMVALFIGDKNTHTGDYYLRVDGGTAVYTVDATFFAAFDHTLLDMAQLESWPVSEAQEVTALVVEGGGNSYSVAARTESDGEDSVTLYTFTDADGSFDTADAAAASVLEAAAELSFTSMAAFRPDEAALDGFGLDASAVRVTVSYTDASGGEAQAALSVGAKTDGGEYYVRIDGSDCVHLMDADALEALLAFSGSYLPEYTAS